MIASWLWLASALAFNGFSAAADKPFTATNPLVGSALLTAAMLVAARANSAKRRVILTLLAASLAFSGVYRHLATHYAGDHHPTAWMLAVLINSFGVLALLADAGLGGLRGFGALALLLALAGSSLELPGGACTASDHPWFPADAEPAPYAGAERAFSRYLEMPDGVKIAVDVYLPQGHDGTAPPLPTFLHATRYTRRMTVRWPFSLVVGDTINSRSQPYVDELVPHGYALVSMDVRGTGASEGSRPMDLLPAELNDLQVVREWVAAQPWSDGHIGTGGISYDGITGAQLAAGAGGAVHAAVFIFAPVDLYSDLCFPGGVKCSGFVDSYGAFTSANERGLPVAPGVDMPLLARIFMNGVFAGPAPVDADVDGRLLAGALAQHAAGNWDMTEALRSTEFANDTIVEHGGQRFSAANAGTTPDVMQAVRDNGVATYSYAGYYDSGAIRSAERMHEVNEGRDKMTVGPWTHGIRASCSPFHRGTKPCFPLMYDVRRFLDAHLRPEAAHVLDEPAVHYFVQGAEEWRSARSWPPPVAGQTRLWAGPGGSLQAERGEGSVRWTPDPRHTTGVVSRWNLVQAVLKQPVTYPRRAEQDKHCLTFTSAPLRRDLTITGAPVLTLRVAAGGDPTFFAYLEDVGPSSGDVRYVTEGQVRAAHRGGLATRTYLPAQFRLMPGSGSEYEVEIGLEPVSYRFHAGRQVRLALAGADVDNFLVSGESSGDWEVSFSTDLVLPLDD